MRFRLAPCGRNQSRVAFDLLDLGPLLKLPRSATIRAREDSVKGLGPQAFHRWQAARAAVGGELSEGLV